MEFLLEEQPTVPVVGIRLPLNGRTKAETSFLHIEWSPSEPSYNEIDCRVWASRLGGNNGKTCKSP